MKILVRQFDLAYKLDFIMTFIGLIILYGFKDFEVCARILVVYTLLKAAFLNPKIDREIERLIGKNEP